MKIKLTAILLLISLLALSSCAPKQSQVDEAMEMIISIYYSGTLAATYGVGFDGFELTNDGYDIQIILDELDVKSFYAEMNWLEVPPYKTISGTIHISPTHTYGVLDLTAGPIKNIDFDTIREPKIIADGAEFSNMSASVPE